MKLSAVILSSFGSVAVLFILTKLMGNKQISQLNMFDYIIGISIGSIAAEAATTPKNLTSYVVAMTVYAVVAVGFSVLCSKSVVFRRFGFGKTLVLYKDNVFYRKNLQKAKLDINEISARCRVAGYFNFCDLRAIYLEPNGTVSFLPFAKARPVTPKDLSVVVQNDSVMYNVITDGKVLPQNLAVSGHDMRWLMSQLKLCGYKTADEVFYAVCDSTSLYAFSSTDKPATEDIFE